MNTIRQKKKKKKNAERQREILGNIDMKNRYIVCH